MLIFISLYIITLCDAGSSLNSTADLKLIINLDKKNEKSNCSNEYHTWSLLRPHGNDCRWRNTSTWGSGL